ncbi:MAG: heavy metal translocating P-type ATPase, partial [Bryobacteraceae bacterium]|nr:heavy metal translocating P-type ATPase [Bryobacteraceae bacterium]
PLAEGLIQNWRARRLSLEPLFALGLAGAFAASLASTLSTGTGLFRSWSSGGFVYYEVSSILLVVYSIGRVVTGEAESRALRAFSLLAAAAERCLVRCGDGSLRETRVAEIQPGDVIAVPAGEMAAVDGIVEQGEALCRGEAVTGESFLVAKRPGDAIPAGLIPVDAALWIRATVAGAHRSLDRIAEAIRQSRLQPSPLERTAARAALWLTPAVASAALLTAAWWYFRAGAGAALMNGLAVLVVACPCALGFATPLALWAAMSRFAIRGAWLRNGEALERIAEADIVLLDKTGTLTRVDPRLESFVTAPGTPVDRQRLLVGLAQIEQLSGHPIAAAFRPCPAAHASSILVREVRLLPGRGVAALWEDPAGGQRFSVAIGLPDGLVSSAEQQTWGRLVQTARPPAGARLLAVAVDGRVAALAAIGETPLAELQGLWKGLSDLGVECRVVSGDGPERVAALGHPQYHAPLTPLEKLALVRRLRAEGRKVLYVGDGINDAAAMAESHVSLAVEAGAPLARETAHGVIRAGAAAQLAELLRIARSARSLARTNLAYAAAYNIAGMAVAAAGWLHPVFAALLMTCSSLMVVWRAAAFLAPDLEGNPA